MPSRLYLRRGKMCDKQQLPAVSSFTISEVRISCSFARAGETWYAQVFSTHEKRGLGFNFQGDFDPVENISWKTPEELILAAKRIWKNPVRQLSFAALWQTVGFFLVSENLLKLELNGPQRRQVERGQHHANEWMKDRSTTIPMRIDRGDQAVHGNDLIEI